MSKKSRVSNDHDVPLPVELIHSIQLLLPSFKEVTRTCILSKSWLRAWSTIPALKFREPNSNNNKLDDEKQTKYKNLVHGTLQRYHRNKIPLECFHLQSTITKNIPVSLAQSWINLVVSKIYLKDLSLDITMLVDDSITLTDELFSSQNLCTIRVNYLPKHAYRGSRIEIANYAPNYVYKGSRLQICTNPVINCAMSLRVMDFHNVIITQDVFHKLLSTCTLLEKIRLFACEGLKNLKVKNLPRLRDLDILSIQEDESWEINNVPSLRSFSCRMRFLRYPTLSGWRESLPLRLDDSLSSVTHLYIDGVILQNSFFDIVQSKLPLLESLSLQIGEWQQLEEFEEDMVITSVSLKWLTLNCVLLDSPVNVQVYAPRLLTFTYQGNVPRLMFPTIAPEQINLIYYKHMDRHFFFKLREILNLSNKFEIKITHCSLDSVVLISHNDVDDLRKWASTSFPVSNVQLSLQTRLGEHVWKHSRFFDALFLICRPSYIRSSKVVIRKMMECNKTGLKDVHLKNPNNGKWEALTSSCKSLLDTLTGDLVCKLSWFPQ